MKSSTTVKHIFDAGDFDGAGQYVVRSHKAEIEDAGFLSTIMYKIGYIHGAENQLYCLIAMSDGWVQPCYFEPIPGSDKRKKVEFTSKQILIDWMNAEDKFRMATKKEVIRVVEQQRHRWLETLIDN